MISNISKLAKDSGDYFDRLSECKNSGHSDTACHFGSIAETAVENGMGKIGDTAIKFGMTGATIGVCTGNIPMTVGGAGIVGAGIATNMASKKISSFVKTTIINTIDSCDFSDPLKYDSDGIPIPSKLNKEETHSEHNELNSETTASTRSSEKQTDGDVEKQSKKPTEKTIIKETNNYYYDFIEIIENKEDNDFETKQKNLAHIHSSLNSLQQSAMMAGYRDLGNVIGVASQIINIGMNYNTLSQAGMSILSSFSGTIGMISATITIAQMVFGRKKDTSLNQAIQALSNLIVQGFTMVLKEIQVLHKRFDHIEDIMIRQHIDSMNKTFELLKQSDRIQNLIFRGLEMAQEQHEVVSHDISRVMSNFNTCSALIQNNINAFRCENLHQIITEINYNTGTGLLTQPMIHKFIAILDGYYDTIAMNGLLTGESIKKQDPETQLVSLKVGMEDIVSVQNYFSQKKLGHPAILKVLTTYTSNLVSLLNKKTEYHDAILIKMKQSYDEASNYREWKNPIAKPIITLDKIKSDYIETKFKKSKMAVEHYFQRDLEQCFVNLQQVFNKKLYDQYDKVYKDLRQVFDNDGLSGSEVESWHPLSAYNCIFTYDTSHEFMSIDERARIDPIIRRICNRVMTLTTNEIAEQKMELIRKYMKQSFTYNKSIIATFYNVDSGDSITVPINVLDKFSELAKLMSITIVSDCIIKMELKSSKKDNWTISTLSIINVLTNYVVASKSFPKQDWSLFNSLIFKHKPIEELIDLVFGGEFAKGYYAYIPLYDDILHFRIKLTIPTESNDTYLTNCYSKLDFNNLTELYEPSKEWALQFTRECESNHLEYRKKELEWNLYETSQKVLQLFINKTRKLC